MIEDLRCHAGDAQIRLQAAPKSAGYPVLVHPGTPGSRDLFGPQVEKAARRGIRLISGGGPFALACAALLPDRVSATVVMASLAPYDAAGLDWAARFSERADRNPALLR
jgi:pimeloyl-ACP methyl ester carboxylesterase